MDDESDAMCIAGVTFAETESPGIVEGLVSKQNTKAFIWKHFGFSTDGNGRPRGNPKCRLCGTEVLAKDSNTSNLYSHLRYKHPEEHSIVQAATGAKGKKTNDDRDIPSAVFAGQKY